MKHIVVLGGGFAGVAAVLRMQKKLSPKETKITLIDKNAYHLFTPSLYEVATSEEKKGNIAIPFQEIFGKKVEIIQGIVEKIDTVKQVIHFREDKDAIRYDYLLIALGSTPAYFHIRGLEENGIALKSLSDAIKVRNKILNMCCKEGQCHKKVQVVIGGGGFSGTEIAAELLTYKKKIAKQHHLDPNCLAITIIQGSDRLLKELDVHVSKIAEKRLKEPNMTFAFGGHIKKVTKTSVFTDDNKVYPYDLLIWTGGVQANPLAWKSNLPVNKRGQVITNNFLQAQGYEHIFVAGDIAQYISEKTQNAAPGVVQVAEDEGKRAGDNIARSIQKKSLKPYTYHHWGYIVPLKGKFAAAELMGTFHFDGFFGWILQQLIVLNYFLGILPLWKAMGRWDKFETELEQ